MTMQTLARTHDHATNWTAQPSWQIMNCCEDDVCDFATAASFARSVANLRRFILEPQETYSIEEAAEMIAVEPGRVIEVICDRDASDIAGYLRRNGGRVNRADVFNVATRRTEWTEDTVSAAFAVTKKFHEK